MDFWSADKISWSYDKVQGVFVNVVGTVACWIRLTSGRSFERAKSMIIGRVVDMNIKAARDEEWMRCGGERSEQGVEFTQENTERLAVFGSVGWSVYIKYGEKLTAV